MFQRSSAFPGSSSPMCENSGMRWFASASSCALIAIILAFTSLLAAGQTEAQPPAQSAPMRTHLKTKPQKVTDHSSGCHGLDGGEVHKVLGNGYVLNIRPAPSEMEALCFVDVLDTSGHALFEL